MIEFFRFYDRKKNHHSTLTRKNQFCYFGVVFADMLRGIKKSVRLRVEPYTVFAKHLNVSSWVIST